MTPEEAKPTTVSVNVWKPEQRKLVSEQWQVFTAKETAEIANAYADALDEYTDKWAPDSVREEIRAWRAKFEEWSK